MQISVFRCLMFDEFFLLNKHHFQLQHQWIFFDLLYQVAQIFACWNFSCFKVPYLEFSPFFMNPSSLIILNKHITKTIFNLDEPFKEYLITMHNNCIIMGNLMSWFPFKVFLLSSPLSVAAILYGCHLIIFNELLKRVWVRVWIPEIFFSWKSED